MIYVRLSVDYIVSREKLKYTISDYQKNYEEILKKGDTNFKRLERKQTVRQNFISELYSSYFNMNFVEGKEE